jgi:hypothetical protein
MSFIEDKDIEEVRAIANRKIKPLMSNYDAYRERDLARAILADTKLRDEDPNKYFLRKKRREKEISKGIVVPPGEWDDDLDMYNEDEYLVHIGSGFLGKIRRNMMRSWNGYVIVPDGHWTIGKNLTGYDLPFRISYHKDREIGFDHCSSKDVLPAGGIYNEIDSKEKKVYTTMIQVIKEVAQLAKFIQEIKN